MSESVIDGRVNGIAEGALKPGGDIPEIVISATGGWSALKLHELWEYRELLFFLIWRDVKIRYKQTALGAAWAILQPFMTMIVFTVIFGMFANFQRKIPDGVPYPVYTFAALLPWSYFSQAIARSSGSLVGSANLISKVYFPRLIVPISAAIAPFVDFALSFVILIGMMIWYGVTPTYGIIFLPVFLLLATLTALSVSLWLTALNVKYRDVGYTIPFLIQIWMYGSPIAYPITFVPEEWRLLYSFNPIVGVVEGFRWALLGLESPDFGVMAISTAVVMVLLTGGLYYFKRTERTFADVI